MFPEELFPMPSPSEEDLEGEEDLLRQYINEKSSDDGAYAFKLLDLLKEGTLEQQVSSLEQLGFIDQPGISTSIKEWLSEKPRHPHIQFKALQTLKLMGSRDSLSIRKRESDRCTDRRDTARPGGFSIPNS